MQKIIITGATSMLGTAVIREYLQRNKNATNVTDATDTVIYAVVRPNSEKLHRLPQDERIKIVECEAGDYKHLLKEKIHDTCDTFFHFAWDGTGANREKSTLNQAFNVVHTLAALTVAKQLDCKKFIGAGSQAEYGRLDLPSINEDSPAKPAIAYGIAKYAAGQLALIEAKKLDIDCFWVRVFSVYGQYDKPTSMISNAVNKMLKREKTSFTPALQRWDYLNCDDAGKAFYAIAEKAKGQGVYCLGSGKPRQLKEFIKSIRDIINPQTDTTELGIGDIPYRGNEVMNLCADISKIERDTGWKPSISFEDGIRQLVALTSRGG